MHKPHDSNTFHERKLAQRYACIYIYTHMLVCMFVCMWACMCVHTYIHTHMHAGYAAGAKLYDTYMQWTEMHIYIHDVCMWVCVCIVWAWNNNNASLFSCSLLSKFYVCIHAYTQNVQHASVWVCMSACVCNTCASLITRSSFWVCRAISSWHFSTLLSAACILYVCIY
jgi:hypothetical protein